MRFTTIFGFIAIIIAATALQLTAAPSHAMTMPSMEATKVTPYQHCKVKSPAEAKNSVKTPDDLKKLLNQSRSFVFKKAALTHKPSGSFRHQGAGFCPIGQGKEKRQCDISGCCIRRCPPKPVEQGLSPDSSGHSLTAQVVKMFLAPKSLWTEESFLSLRNRVTTPDPRPPSA